MKAIQKRSTWKPKPVRVQIVFRAYASIFAAAGLSLLLGGVAPQVKLLGSLSLVTACCAAGLSAVGNLQLRNRSLFWFAVSHVALWLILLGVLKWVWGPGPSDQAAAIAGGTAFMLFCLWLTAEGELPQASCRPNFLGPTPREVVRTYEQKMRQAAAQEERNRLARDLHDSIKQQIFAIQTAAATAQTRFDGDSNGAREALEQIRSAAREAMTEMEVMLDQLTAEPLENTGLIAALKKLCESIGFRTGARVEFKLGEVPPTGLTMPGAAEATLRVAQEALANVARHARASHVTVSLQSADGRMELTVQDDGAGFDPNQDSRGMGTANMRARAEELGGRLELISGREAGTTVKFSIPSRVPAKPGNIDRNKTILLALTALAILFNPEVHHWSFAPALTFALVLAVKHYRLGQARVRRLMQPLV